MSKKKLLIGAHTSTQGGVHNALVEGQEIGATCIQIFTANQRQWKSRPITDEMADLWFAAREETGIEAIMSHSSYLINLGCPQAENLEKSRAAFRQEIERCLKLDLTFLNFHPGAALDGTVEQCINRIISSLKACASLLEKSRLTLLIEATAGQGTVVGHRFEELSSIIEGVKDHLPIGVCIDTCHIFAAGYDVRDVDAVLKEFDKVVGLKYLKAFHLNDSLGDLGSRKDRHMPLGKGRIGIDCFKDLMRDKRTRELPKYLETPDGPALWKKEIALLRSF